MALEAAIDRLHADVMEERNRLDRMRLHLEDLPEFVHLLPGDPTPRLLEVVTELEDLAREVHLHVGRALGAARAGDLRGPRSHVARAHESWDRIVGEHLCSPRFLELAAHYEGLGVARQDVEPVLDEFARLSAGCLGLSAVLRECWLELAEHSMGHP